MKTTIQNPIDTSEIEVPNFGNGKYSAKAVEVFKDSIRLLGLTPEQAERAGNAWQSELGRYFSEKAGEISFGRLKTKDMTLSLKELTKLKDIRLTNALCVARLCSLMQEAKHYGATGFTVQFTKTMQDWLDDVKDEEEVA